MYLNGGIIARELKALRVKNGYTAKEVSDGIKIHSNTILKYEKDATNMQLGTLKKILDFYNLDEFIFFNILREYNHQNIKR